MTGSSVLDGNRFDPGDVGGVDPADRELVRRRMRVLGPGHRLFYRRPVHLVRGAGSYLYGPEGEQYLDAYNNVASIGHAHPAVVEAVHRQLAQLNTHSRYLQSGVVDYAEQLLATLPAPLDQVMFTNSGSEANDLALRVAAAATGGTGVVVTAEAYHGTTTAVAAFSPANGHETLGPHVRTVAAPDALRFDPARHPDGLGAWFGAGVRAAFDELAAAGHRPCALFLDSIFASDGVLTDPTVLGPAVAAAHAAGAVVVADEVQPGFARTGTAFWGFARHHVEPDLVTLGKPMGNGVPVAGLVARADVLAPFAGAVAYFNTFGGSTMPVAAAKAVLDVIQSEGLAARAEELGTRIRTELAAATAGLAHVGDIRGAGMYFGVELVVPGTTTPDGDRAVEVVNTLRENRVLISVAGPHSNVLKIRPPLCYSDADAARLVEALATALASALAAPGPGDGARQ